MQNMAAAFLSFCGLRDLETFESKAAPVQPPHAEMARPKSRQCLRDHSIRSPGWPLTLWELGVVLRLFLTEDLLLQGTQGVDDCITKTKLGVFCHSRSRERKGGTSFLHQLHVIRPQPENKP